MWEEEFDRQVNNLLNKGYSKISGLTQEQFINLLNPLKNSEYFETDFAEGRLPFVIVIKSELIPTENAMSLVEYQKKLGVTKLFPLKPTDFKSLESVIIPENKAYLIINIDRGKKTLNITPKKALEQIIATNRSPLTIEEGIAILTHFPQFLIKNNCFSLPASRRTGDKRVPAIWINSKKQPNLGWCWEGNPHTWLGSASCETRIS